MTINRFEQVGERQDDAVTLFLLETGTGARGYVTCPAAVSGGVIAEDQITEEAQAKDAFRSAVRMANEFKAPLVVVDPSRLWQADWGVLYRHDEA